MIDLRRAEVFARELLPLDDELAVRAEALVMPRVARMTTGKLAAALQRAVLAVDPAAAQQRKEQAEKDARVEAWGEPGRGTAALAGRDLPAAEVIAADKRITAAARWLRGRGARGGMDWLRSRAYLGFLTGYGLDDLLARLLAQGDGGQDDAGDSTDDATRAAYGTAEGTGPDGDSQTSGGPADRPASSDAAGASESVGEGLGGFADQSGDTEGLSEAPGRAASVPSGAATPEDGGASAGAASGGGSAGPAGPRASAGGSDGLGDGSRVRAGLPADGSERLAGGPPLAPGLGSPPMPPGLAGSALPPGLATPPVPPGLAALTGSVNLVMPALAWLGLTDAPGEITGTPAGGPADATTCRDLATALAARGDTRWCLTLTDSDGRAIAHGCARRGPGGSAGPGPLARAGPGPPGPLGWLRSIPLIPIARGECAHRLEVPGYRPSPRLRHQVTTRSPRCSFPGCRRPAVACDDDHTLAWHLGGRTCECNLAPLCRRHHRAKQAPGWQLAQPRPGTVVWTLPSGRSYTTEPEPYPV